MGNLNVLDIRGSQDILINRFAYPPQLSIVYMDYQDMCCIFPRQTKCITGSFRDENIYLCSGIIPSYLGQIAVWGFSAIILVSNLFTIVIRLKLKLTFNNLCIMSLAVSDSLFGLYFLLLGAVNVKYHESFAYQHTEWVNSLLCRVMASTHLMSLMMLSSSYFLVQLDRMVFIILPFTATRYKPVFVTSVTLSWFACGIISQVLLFVKKIKNSQCVILGLSGSSGLFDMLIVFVIIGFNLIFLLSGLACNTYAMTSYIRSRQMAGKRIELRDRNMVYKTTAISLINLSSWLATLTLSCLTLSDNVDLFPVIPYLFITCLPINSLLNSLLYTFCNQQIRTRLRDFIGL